MLQYGQYHANVHLKFCFDTWTSNVSSYKNCLQRQVLPNIQINLWACFAHFENLVLGGHSAKFQKLFDRKFDFRSIFRILLTNHFTMSRQGIKYQYLTNSLVVSIQCFRKHLTSCQVMLMLPTPNAYCNLHILQHLCNLMHCLKQSWPKDMHNIRVVVCWNLQNWVHVPHKHAGSM